MEITEEHIRFRVIGDVLEKLNDWEMSNDELVFREQLSTGSFRGKLKVNGETLKLLQYADQQGKILPHYGVGGSRGASSYQFKPELSKCSLIAQHAVTEETIELDSEQVLPVGLAPAKYQFVFTINDVELTNLRQWEHWVEKQALSGSYVYYFGTVSMGKGFRFQVTDTKTGNSIDITNYEDW